MNKIILSPPFSNLYPNIKGTTKIVGTYTLKRRRGMYRIITTLRKTKKGWVNNVGLRNPGIKKYNKKNAIVSIALQDLSQWKLFYEVIKYKKEKYNIKGIEFNISCPNHAVEIINNNIIKEFKKLFDITIVKMPHNSSYEFIDKMCSTDIDILHISNTKRTKKGGLSGRSLIYKNIKKIKYIKKNYDKKVIAGGGIYSIEDFLKYKEAGADYFSLSTILINPFKAYKLIKQISNLY